LSAPSPSDRLTPEAAKRGLRARGTGIETGWRFAVIADSHVEPDIAAPANLRLGAVVDAIAKRKPDFVLHLGDVVHPLPSSPRAAPARLAADALLARLRCPLLLIPGNHDIGDKPLETSPAAMVSDATRTHWTQSHGADFRLFDHRDRRFVLINAAALNGSTTADHDLDDLLTRAGSDLGGRNIVLASHYPLFLDTVDEPSHYDNIGPPARDRLLAFCRDQRVEAAFSGHIHNFLYRTIGGTRLLGAPSTAFLRRDFSELAHVAPLAEHGREDPAKLGFFWVEALPDELVVRLVSLEDLDEFSTGQVQGYRRREAPVPLGVNLRHDWAKVAELPFNPPTDTFWRKRVRDDYTLDALLRLGLRDLRIPATDLLDAEKRQRFEELSWLGFRFTLFLAPSWPRRLLEVLDAHGPGIDTLECIVRGTGTVAFEPLLPLAGRHGFALALGPLLAPDFIEAKTAHQVRYGFSVACDASARTAAAALSHLPGRRGMVFSVPMNEFGAEEAQTVAAYAAGVGIEPTVLLERAAPDMVALDDDRVLPQRVAGILALARAHPDLRLVLDSFMSVDRGYHVRSGLVDRRFNLTAAGKVLRAANSFVESISHA